MSDPRPEATGRSYFAPCVGTPLAFEERVVDAGQYRVHRRLWQTSTSDLATLATKHKLHMPYTLMDVYLNYVRSEIEFEVCDALSIDDAHERLGLYRVMLYLSGIRPFVLPFVATHSINDYSGINYRDSELLREKLPPEMREGTTSDTASVEVWPHDNALTLVLHEPPPGLTAHMARKAGEMVHQWIPLERNHPELRAVRQALEIAPQIGPFGSSLLHLWIGIESLFPNVSAEVSFRLSLLIAQLCSPIKSASVIYGAAKRSYGHRSRAAHGGTKQVGYVEWAEAWKLLCVSMLAVLHRGELPSEQALISSLLDR